MPITSAFEGARINWIGELQYESPGGMVLTHSSNTAVQNTLDGMSLCIVSVGPGYLKLMLSFADETRHVWSANDIPYLGPKQDKNNGCCHLQPTKGKLLIHIRPE